jgi:hypothetical protein
MAEEETYESLQNEISSLSSDVRALSIKVGVLERTRMRVSYSSVKVPFGGGGGGGAALWAPPTSVKGLPKKPKPKTKKPKVRKSPKRGSLRSWKQIRKSALSK